MLARLRAALPGYRPGFIRTGIVLLLSVCTREHASGADESPESKQRQRMVSRQL